MKIKSLSFGKLQKPTISISRITDWTLLFSIFLFSSYDCLVRVFPVLPYSTLRLILFALLLILAVAGKYVKNQRAVLFLIGIYCIVGLSFLLSSGSQTDYIKTLFLQVSAIAKLWAFFIAFALIKQPEKWQDRLLWLAYLNVFLLCFTAFSGKYISSDRGLNYVGLGISAAMWVPIIIQNAFLTQGKKRFFHILGTTVSILFVAVYGNRGSLIAIIAYVIYCIIKYTKIRRKLWIILSLCLLGAIIYLYQDLIMNIIANQVAKFGIYSRNMVLYSNGNLAFTTHRTDEIWVIVLKAIKENPILGYGLCYDRVLNGAIDIYAHNIVLELLLSFGIPIGCLLFFIHVIFGWRVAIGYMEDDWERLFSPFWVTSTVLLMFNNSFCQLGFFWIPYGIYFAYLKKNKLKHLKKARN